MHTLHCELHIACERRLARPTATDALLRRVRLVGPFVWARCCGALWVGARGSVLSLCPDQRYGRYAWSWLVCLVMPCRCFCDCCVVLGSRVKRARAERSPQFPSHKCYGLSMSAPAPACPPLHKCYGGYKCLLQHRQSMDTL